MKRVCRAMAVLLLLAVPLAGCQVVIIPVPIAVAPAATEEAAPADSAGKETSVAVNDPALLTQLDAIDAACDQGTTHARQQQALDELRPWFAGREVELAGTVIQARDLDNMFDAIVVVDGTSREVRIPNVPEDVALALEIGQPVTVAGAVEVACTAYVQIQGTVSAR